jgi:hypothetical protein
MTENKESKFFEPKEGEGYFYLAAHWVIEWENNSEQDKRIIARGAYRTEAEAIQADNVRLALKRVWDSADSAKYFFRPDWGDDKQAKHYCFYDHANKKFNWGCDLCAQGNPFLPHFKSSEDCLAFAKENEKDLRIIWGV